MCVVIKRIPASVMFPSLHLQVPKEKKARVEILVIVTLPKGTSDPSVLRDPPVFLGCRATMERMKAGSQEIRGSLGQKEKRFDFDLSIT